MSEIAPYTPNQELQETIPPVLDQSETVSPAIAADRAQRANFGLQGKITQTYPELNEGIANGQEQNLRDSAAAQIALRNKTNKNKVLVGAAVGMDRPLTPDDVNAIDRKVTEPAYSPTVFEDHFAQNYLSHLYWQNKDPDATGWMKDAQKDWPAETDAYKKIGEGLVATNELLYNRLQNLSSQIADQSILSKIWDIGRTNIPLYQDARLRGLIDGTGFHLGLGNNLEDQSSQFYMMTKPEQVQTLDKIHESLQNNPHLEAAYLSALLGQSGNERLFNNITTPLDIATGYGVAKGVTKAVFPQLAVKSAVKGMVDSIGSRIVSSDIAAPAVAGDLETAALRKAMDDTVNTLAGNDPRRNLYEGLWNFFKGNVNDLYQNPGNYGADLANQLKDSVLWSRDALTAKLSNMMRVERIPFMRAMQANYEAAKENLKRYVPGIETNILDIGYPTKTIANNWQVEYRLGNAYGIYFDEPEHAEAYAKLKQLEDYSIGGKPVSFEDKIARLENRPPNELHEPATITEVHGKPVLKEVTPEAKSIGGEELKPGERAHKIVTEPVTRTIPGVAKTPDSGTGYYISIFRPWNETDQFTRNEIATAIKTGAYGSNTPDSNFHSFIGGLLAGARTPEETMSLFARTQRGISTFGPHVLRGIAAKMGEDVVGLSRGTYPFSAKRAKWNDFKRIVESAQSIVDPETGKPGYTFKNPGELEYQYRKLLGRSPDEQEVKAYFSWKNLNDLDWTLRNLSVYRNKARLGAMNISIKTKDLNGESINSEHFDAIPRDVNNLPGDGKVLHMNDGLDTMQILSTQSLREGTEAGTAIRTGKNKAGQFVNRPQVYEIYDQYARPLQGWGKVKNERIRYVVGNFETKNLDFNQLPRTGGGHFIYEYPHYLKQAIINKETNDKGVSTWHYEGDKTAFAIRSRAEGKQIEKALNGFRELIRDGKYEEAKEFLKNNSFGYNYKDAYEMFKPLPKRNSLGRMIKAEPFLDLNESIRLMDNNRTIGDAFANEFTNRFGKRFVNGLKSGNPASQYQVAFTGERDVRELMTILDVGGKGNPVFKAQAAELVDPITALNRSLSNISNSFFFDDLKIGFMEHWLQEAKPYLDLRPKELENRAFSLFHDPPWLKRPNADQMERIKQLQVVRSQHLQLVQRPSQQESILMSIAQKLTDSIYKNIGPRFVVSPLSIYAVAKDGPTFMRGMAAHFKLGMFNPNQLIKQMNTWATIMGIEGPVRASQGAAAAYMYHLTSWNRSPGVLNSMSKIVEKFGWKPGEYHEFVDLIDNSGFGTVAGDHAYRDNAWSGGVFSNGASRFLSLGDSFFTEGERNIRYGAMATAYRKFRDAHPTGALSDADKEEILQRARLLNVNMDRAANSLWQSGLSSIPLQFQTYALRTAELMWGKRLTRIEKTRLFATYSTLYGLPIGSTLWGFPIADHLRQMASDQGYNVGEDYIKGTLMEGIPAMIGQMITGNTYSVGQSYGTSGVGNYMFDLHSDATMWDIILSTAMGPSGGILADTFANTDPLRRWAMNIYTDGNETSWEDVVKAWKAISTIRTGDQLRMALQTGNWYSSKGTLLDTDVNPMDAIWMFLSGLNHQQISDAYLKTRTKESEKADNEYTEKLFTERWHKGIFAAQTGAGYNPDQARKYFSDAANILKMRNYPLDEYNQLYARAMEGQENLVDSIDRSFALTHVQGGKEESRMQQYQKQMDLRNK